MFRETKKTGKSFLFGMALFIALPAASHPSSCKDVLERFAKPLGYQTAKASGLAAYHSGKALAYPVVEPLDLIIRSIAHYRRDGRAGMAGNIGTNFLKSLGHAQIFTMLWLFGRMTGMTLQEFDDDVSEDEKELGDALPLPRGIRVIADGFEGDVFERVQFVRSRTETESRATHRIRFRSQAEFLLQLKQLSQRFGPIAQLEIYDHGTPGFPENFGSPTGLAEDVTEKGVIELQDSMFDPRGVFSAGARVKFVSCSLGSGARGKEFCSSFATALLVPNGGGVTYSARVPIGVGALEIATAWAGLPQPPSWMTRVQTPLLHAIDTAENFIMRREENQNGYFPRTAHRFVLNRVATETHSSAFPDLRKYLYLQLPERINKLRKGLITIEEKFESLFEQEYRGAMAIAEKAKPDRSDTFIANGETLYIRVDETKPIESLEEIVSEIRRQYPASRIELDRPDADDKSPRFYIKVTAPTERIAQWSARVIPDIEKSILPETQSIAEEIQDRIEKARAQLESDPHLLPTKRKLLEGELKTLGQVMVLQVLDATLPLSRFRRM